MSTRVALAVAAHPDDIEFMMAGTLLLLREAGYETHYLNVADGSCGSSTESAARTRQIRRREAKEACRLLGARFHPSLAIDLEIFYNAELLRRIAAIIRKVRPSILLTHSLEDYMEDHTNTARLAVSAAFARGMPNFASKPARPAVPGDITLYHALPHGLRDALGRRVMPEAYVDVSSVIALKLEALAAHRSQQGWLDSSQGMPSYLKAMQESSREVGRLSGRFRFAEGWRRHNPLGFCAPQADPLRQVLGKKCRIDPAYARSLDAGPRGR